ncbi:MAG: hypothetical protein WC489_07405 [Patescibacteria group bacterium]
MVREYSSGQTDRITQELIARMPHELGPQMDAVRDRAFRATSPFNLFWDDQGYLPVSLDDFLGSPHKLPGGYRKRVPVSTPMWLHDTIPGDEVYMAWSDHSGGATLNVCGQPEDSTLVSINYGFRQHTKGQWGYLPQGITIQMVESEGPISIVKAAHYNQYAVSDGNRPYQSISDHYEHIHTEGPTLSRVRRVKYTASSDDPRYMIREASTTVGITHPEDPTRVYAEGKGLFNQPLEGIPYTEFLKVCEGGQAIIVAQFPPDQSLLQLL